MIADSPAWLYDDIPYIACPSSSAVSQPLRSFIELGSKSALLSPEELKLTALGGLKSNWDLRGSPAPMVGAVQMALQWLPALRDSAQRSGFPWKMPHLSASEAAEITFEWWHAEKKITLYFGDDVPEYVKVWGPHIFDQMESGTMVSSDSFRLLWLWLNAA